jgi:hypothetical protein
MHPGVRRNKDASLRALAFACCVGVVSLLTREEERKLVSPLRAKALTTFLGCVRITGSHATSPISYAGRIPMP